MILFMLMFFYSRPLLNVVVLPKGNWEEKEATFQLGPRRDGPHAYPAINESHYITKSQSPMIERHDTMTSWIPHGFRLKIEPLPRSKPNIKSSAIGSSHEKPFPILSFLRNWYSINGGFWEAGEGAGKGAEILLQEGGENRWRFL